MCNIKSFKTISSKNTSGRFAWARYHWCSSLQLLCHSSSYSPFLVPAPPPPPFQACSCAILPWHTLLEVLSVLQAAGSLHCWPGGANAVNPSGLTAQSTATAGWILCRVWTRFLQGGSLIRISASIGRIRISQWIRSAANAGRYPQRILSRIFS